MLGFKNFLLDEDGAGVVEMILIIVVLIGLVLIFKKQLTTLVNNIFQTISREADIVCSTMVMGLTIAGTISVILIASGRAGRKKQIAFTPFLLLGYGLTEVFM